MKNSIKPYVVSGIRIIIFDGEQYANFDDILAFVRKNCTQNNRPIRYTISEIAKEYEISAVKLNNILKAEHIQYRSKGVWHINSKYGKKGYVVSVSGRNKKTHMYWTFEGKKFIESLLEADGYQKVKAD